MKAIIHVTKPQEVELTASITMTLGEWTRLRNVQSHDNHAGRFLQGVVDRMIEKAQVVIEASEEAE